MTFSSNLRSGLQYRWIAQTASENGVRNSNSWSSVWLWFTQALKQNAVISDDIIQQKARYFGGELGITEVEFSYSRGWLARFKSRFSISLHKLSGEAESADKNAVLMGRAELQKVLAEYHLDDIFNFDETGLFFRLPPNATLASHPVQGCKRAKDRLTVGLISNATGTYKGKPVVIWKSAHPRCFEKHYDPNVIVTYRHNSTAWMTTTLFSDVVTRFDSQMAADKRSVLLLIDNCSSHKVTTELRATRLYFLPPNTTSHLQPLDAGIIQNFKVKYRKLLVRHFIDCIDSQRTMTVDVKQAIQFISIAWAEVLPNTIANCWKHRNSSSNSSCCHSGQCRSTKPSQSWGPDRALDISHSTTLTRARNSRCRCIRCRGCWPTDNRSHDRAWHSGCGNRARTRCRSGRPHGQDQWSRPWPAGTTTCVYEWCIELTSSGHFLFEQRPNSSQQVQQLSELLQTVLSDRLAAKRQSTITDFFHWTLQYCSLNIYSLHMINFFFIALPIPRDYFDTERTPLNLNITFPSVIRLSGWFVNPDKLGWNTFIRINEVWL